MNKMSGDGLELIVVSNRGMKVWPDGAPETFCTDNWSCRFMAKGGGPVTHQQIIALLGRVAEAGIDFIKTEGLYDFDGKAGYTLGQGQ
jgi:isocitrate dehydrogenase